MATIEQTLADKLHALTPDRLRTVELFVVYLLESQRRTELEAQPVANVWPAGYFENVIGSMPDFPDVPRDGWGLDEGDDDLGFDFDDQPS